MGSIFIPLPFARVRLIIEEPVVVSPDGDEEAFEHQREEIEELLIRSLEVH